jgi:ParB family chromosome partitioning protein
MSTEFKYTEEVTGEIVQIPIGLLHHHHDNPRKDLGDLTELTDSIKAKGVLQNLTVVPYWFKITGKGCDDPKQQAEMGYLVVIGNRRLEAAKRAGLETLPCIIAKMTPSEQVQTMLLENMQRNDLTLYEQAQGFQMMLDFGDSIETVAEKTGFSQTTIRRRLKMAELDGNTFKSVATRQFSFDDMDKLGKIEDIETRNKVLCEIGTSNFNREFQKAMDAQTDKKRAEGWKEIFDRHGLIEIEEKECWSGKYANLGYVQGDPDESKITELLGDHERLYYAWGYRSTAYIRADKAETAEEQEAQREEDKKREAERQRRDQLDKLEESAFRLRFDFIKNYTYRDSKKNIDKIADWMILREIVSMMSRGMFSGYATVNASGQRFGELFDVKGGDDWEKVAEFIDKHPEKALLMNVYAQWCDNEQAGCTDWSGCFRDNPRLRNLYHGLCLLGYDMSDDEKQLIDGTHPLYKKADEDEAIDTEDDQVEEYYEDTDDDFDAEIKKRLEDLLENIEG